MSLIVVMTNESPENPKVANYRYQVMVGDGSQARSTTLAQGMVMKFGRSKGWKALLLTMLELEIEKEKKAGGP